MKTTLRYLVWLAVLLVLNTSFSYQGKKYVYFKAFTDNATESSYYSKIYTIESYTEDKMNEIKNCLIEKVKLQIGRDKVTVLCTEKVYDNYSKASESWQEETGKKISLDGQCGIKKQEARKWFN